MNTVRPCLLLTPTFAYNEHRLRRRQRLPIYLFDVRCDLVPSYDSVDLEGSTFYSKLRSKCTQSSGGIGIFARNNLVNYHDYIKIIHEKSDCVLWCKIKDTNDHGCLLLGRPTVYIPPESSKYANDDNSEDICLDLIDLSNNLPIRPMGDYNSRTGTFSDFEEFDDDLFNNLNIDVEIRSTLINETNLNDLGITTDRFSKDVKLNTYGHRLIEMCKICPIHICNGRLGNDAFCGKRYL